MLYRQQPPPPEAKISFQITGLSCGSYAYSTNGQPVYVPEVSWTTPNGEVKFARFAVIVTFNSPVGRKRIEIPYRIVDNMVISSATYTLALTLWESPRFFHYEDPSLSDMMGNLSLKNPSCPQKFRLDHLPEGTCDHRETVGQTFVYKLFASPSGFMEMVRRIKDRDILTIHHQEIPEGKRPETTSDAYKSFSRCFLEVSKFVPFSVLYQLEALVRNGYLFPTTVSKLVIKWLKHYDQSQSMISAAAFKKLFSQIPFAGVGVDASTLDVEEIWKYVLENEKEVKSGFSSELRTVSPNPRFFPCGSVCD